MESVIRKWWIVYVALFVFVLGNIFFSHINQRIDLTSSAIYTISDRNAKIIYDSDKKILATLLLGDNVPSAFKKLKNECEFFLSNLTSKNSNIRYDLFDPNQGNPSQVKSLRKIFAERNVYPTNIRVQNNNEMNQSLIYPFIHLESESKDIFVNILESRIPNESEQEAIFRSVNALEFKISKAIHELSQEKKRKVAFVALNELMNRKSFDFINNLSRKFETTIVDPKNLFVQRDSIEVGIIAISQNDNLEKTDLLMIDQYVVNGGSLIWLIEEFDINVDSINNYVEYSPQSRTLPVADYLFTVGVKLSAEWILDLRASRIPQVIGEQGGRAQTELITYPFHPVMEGNADHVITYDLGEVNLSFPTVLDTVMTSVGIEKTPLLTSSEYSRSMNYPGTFSFEFLRDVPDVESYTETGLVSAMLLKGKFQSYFKNRYSFEEKQDLKKLGIDFKDESNRIAKQIIITDQDFIMPGADNQGRPLPMGYNRWERRVFPDNETFITNSIEYLINGDLFLAPEEKKEIVFAAIDKRKAAAESQFWILFNLLSPLLAIMLIYLGCQYFLKQRYG